ncbi:MAG: RsmE family RNA methyltransferase [Bacilli bacterium]
MQRYFALDHNLKLQPSDIHHMYKVMRMKVGEQIEVVYDHEIYLCEIDDIDVNNVKLNIVDKQTISNDIKCHIAIAVSLVSEQKWDYILQKATELGASEIIPLELERTLIRIDRNKQTKKNERWVNICKEASEQSHRISIPTILPVMNIDNLINTNYDLKLVCSTGESSVNLKQILSKYEKCGKILVVIGPEGGISPTEEKRLVDNNFLRVSLGNFILRVETAPLFVLSAINYELMR